MSFRINWVITFIIAAIAGFSVWWLSEAITGHKEAFDAIGYYLLSLVVIGAVCYQKPLISYFAVLIGQLIFFGSMDGKLWVVGLISILLFSLVTPTAAFITAQFIKGVRGSNSASS